MSEQPKELIVKYNVTDASIEELREKYAIVPKVNTSAELKTLKADITVVRTLRTSVEATRKDLKKEALEYGRKVDTEATRIKEKLISIEQPMKDEQKRYEDKIKAAKEEEERLELERVAEIQRKINNITSLPSLNDGKAPHEIEEAIESLNYRDLFDYQEFTSQRDDALVIARESLVELLRVALEKELVEKEAAAQKELEEKERQEAEAKRQQEIEEREKQAAIEQEKIKKERAEMVAKQKKLDDEAEARDAKQLAEKNRLEEERQKIEEEKAALEHEKQAKIEAETAPPKNLITCPHCGKGFELED